MWFRKVQRLISDSLVAGTVRRRRSVMLHGSFCEVLQERCNLDGSMSGLLAASVEVLDTVAQTSQTNVAEDFVTNDYEAPLTPMQSMAPESLVLSYNSTSPSANVSPVTALSQVIGPAPLNVQSLSISSVTLSLNDDGSALVLVEVSGFIDGLAIQFGGVLSGYSVSVSEGSPAILTMQDYQSGFADAQLMSQGATVGTAFGFYVGSV